MNNDLISRAALLEIYKNWLPQLTKPEYAGDRNGIENCIVVLKDAPAVDAVPQWISVDDRLPDDKCIAFNAYGEMMIGRIYRALRGYKCEDGYSEDMLSVTHWMPLPEPPGEVD